MVHLIKIPRLEARVNGMLYRAKFEERISLFEEAADQTIEASAALQDAPKFRELLSVRLPACVCSIKLDGWTCTDPLSLPSTADPSDWKLPERELVRRRSVRVQDQLDQQGPSYPCNPSPVRLSS